MKKKYELTNETFNYGGHILHRIKAVRDFNCIKVGELGGWVESENNLSHEGNCWVYDDAKVYDNAVVKDNAKVCDSAIVCDHARVCGIAKVYENAKVYHNARIDGYAEVCGDACVYDEAKIYGRTKVDGHAEICGYAIIKETKDYKVFKNTWSSNRFFTWTRSNNLWKVGCFYGTGEGLIKKAYKDSEISGKCYEAIVQTVENH